MTYRLEGCLDLAFVAENADKTILHVLAQQPPLKVIRAFEIVMAARWFTFTMFPAGCLVATGST